MLVLQTERRFGGDGQCAGRTEQNPRVAVEMTSSASEQGVSGENNERGKN